MVIDQRILDKFQEEFDASKARAASDQANIDALNTKLSAAQQQLQGELDIQAALNQALAALGQPTLT